MAYGIELVVIVRVLPQTLWLLPVGIEMRPSRVADISSMKSNPECLFGKKNTMKTVKQSG